MHLEKKRMKKSTLIGFTIVLCLTLIGALFFLMNHINNVKREYTYTDMFSGTDIFSGKYYREKTVTASINEILDNPADYDSELALRVSRLKLRTSLITYPITIFLILLICTSFANIILAIIREPDNIEEEQEETSQQ